jgi:ABC-2 type transport system ATP-binding protein
VFLLEARRLSKRYGNVSAIDDLSFGVGAGEVFCLLGPNGAGKTTLINLFLGFIPASGGEALIKGLDVARHPLDTRRVTAYIPEQVMLYPSLSAMENLRFFCELAGHRQYSTADLEGFLAQVGLQPTDVHRRIGTYSKGMRQKVGIAIAVAKRAEVLLLDEPTSGLDPTASNEFANLLADVSAQGRAVLMTTHDLFRARSSGTRMGIMRKGTLVATFDASAVDHHELERAYLRHVQGV